MGVAAPEADEPVFKEEGEIIEFDQRQFEANFKACLKPCEAQPLMNRIRTPNAHVHELKRRPDDMSPLDAYYNTWKGRAVKNNVAPGDEMPWLVHRTTHFYGLKANP